MRLKDGDEHANVSGKGILFYVRTFARALRSIRKALRDVDVQNAASKLAESQRLTSFLISRILYTYVSHFVDYHSTTSTVRESSRGGWKLHR